MVPVTASSRISRNTIGLACQPQMFPSPSHTNLLSCFPMFQQFQQPASTRFAWSNPSVAITTQASSLWIPLLVREEVRSVVDLVVRMMREGCRSRGCKLVSRTLCLMRLDGGLVLCVVFISFTMTTLSFRSPVCVR